MDKIQSLKFHAGQITVIEYTSILRHDILSACLQSKNNVSRFLQLSRSFDSPWMFGRALQ